MATAMNWGRANRFVDNYESSIAIVPSLYNTHHLVNKSQFTSVKEALDWLAKDRSSNPDFDAVWREAVEEWRAMNHGKDPSSAKDMMTVSIIAYTLEEPKTRKEPKKSMYDILNAELRKHGSSGGNWDAFPFKGWWLLLHRALVNVPTSPPNMEPLKRITLYRGTKLKFRFSTRDCAAFGCLTSTSTSLTKAKEFLGPRGTLFEIDCVPMAALGIKQYSAFPDEEEVLLYPFSSFQVKEVKEDGPITRVKLTAAGPVVGYNFQA